MLELHPLFPDAFGYAHNQDLITSNLVKTLSSVDRVANTFNGVSTNNRLFANEEMKPVLSGIHDFIMDQLRNYYHLALGVTLDNCNPVITQSWLTFTQRGEKMHGHRHPNSLVSGVFYINSVKTSDQLIFTKEATYKNFDWYPSPTSQYSGTEYIIPVQTGDLLLFKSGVHHHFNEVDHDEERISLAFNTWLSGSFGLESELTHINLTAN